MNILIALNGECDVDIVNIIYNYNICYQIAVDGGLRHLNKPDLVIGDMDSTNGYVGFKHKKLDPIKDETDFLEAIKYANKLDANCNIFVVGFISLKRPEHFIANLKLISTNIKFISKDTIISYYNTSDTKVEFDSDFKYISIFPLNCDVSITIKNAKYELDNYNLTMSDPLTISNEFINNMDMTVMVDNPCIIFKSRKE